MSYLRLLFSDPMSFLTQAFFRIIAVLISLCCHEWGHAYAAHLCGDDTAKYAGRMTLDPRAHLDPVGALLMFFCGFGYAKPVPINPWYFRGNRRKCDAIVSLAGITVNLVLFLLFSALAAVFSLFLWEKTAIQYYGLSTLLSYRYTAIWYVIEGSAVSSFSSLIAVPALAPIVRLCAYTALVNINLAVFNLIPIPPLDGYHVVNDLIFKGRFHLSEQAFRIAMLAVLALSAYGILGRVIYAVVYPVQDLILLPIRMIWG